MYNRLVVAFSWRFLLPGAVIGLIAGASADDTDPYYGMNQSQFESCINFGKAVVNSQKGTPAYFSAKDDFEKLCDPDKQLRYAITHMVKKVGQGGIPVDPKDWAVLSK